MQALKNLGRTNVKKCPFFLHISKRHPAAERKRGGGGLETRSKDRLSPKQLIGEQETDRGFFYET
jgi:hypothetical protein